MAKKTSREKVKMVSTAETGYYKTTIINKKNMEGKLELKMYDPVVRKHVPFVQKKISS